MNPILELNDVSVKYEQTVAASEVTLSLPTGKIGCLLGPSGCGKTTILRAVAGFEPLSGGDIRLDGQIVSKPGYAIPPEKRAISMVFQDFALFPHLTVEGNIAFGIRQQTGRQRSARVSALLELIGLPGLGHRYPHELSGGQQQRIALARALAPEPKLLLMDEPFGSQDVEIREKLANEVREILLQENISGLLVTHDQNEAFVMADEIGVLRNGQLEQWETGYNLYHKPANRFVADFVGQGRFIQGKVLDDNHVESALGTVSGHVPDGCKAGCPVEILIRPDDILHDGEHQLETRIVARAFRGAEYLYTLELGSGEHILALMPSHFRHEIGQTIPVSLQMDHLVVFSRKPE